MMMLTGNGYVCSRCGTDSENPDKCFRCDKDVIECQHPEIVSRVIHFDVRLQVVAVECKKCYKKWICDSR